MKQYVKRTVPVLVLMCLFFGLMFGEAQAASVLVRPTEQGIELHTEADPGTIRNAYGLLTDGMKRICLALYGISVISALLFFFAGVTAFGAAGDQANERKNAGKSLLIRAAVLSGLGGIGMVAGFFWNLL